MFGEQKVCFSGVQPSGNLTIGNYLGAIKNFAEFSEQYKTFYCVVDEHAITVRQNPADLRRRTYETLALYGLWARSRKKYSLRAIYGARARRARMAPQLLYHVW